MLTQPVLDTNCQEGTDVISHRSCQAHIKFQVNLQCFTVATSGYTPDAGWSFFSVQLLPQNFLFLHQSNVLHPISLLLAGCCTKFTGHGTPSKSLTIIKFVIKWLAATATERQTERDERRTQRQRLMDSSAQIVLAFQNVRSVRPAGPLQNILGTKSAQQQAQQAEDYLRQLRMGLKFKFCP